jgi:hypothetical protein
MITQYLKRQKIIYQFADGFKMYFIFPRVDLEVKSTASLKTNYQENRSIDGVINISVETAFRKSAYVSLILIVIATIINVLSQGKYPTLFFIGYGIYWFNFSNDKYISLRDIMLSKKITACEKNA